MATATFNDVYLDTATVLLENGGLVLGLVTPQQWLDIAGEVLTDLLLKMHIIQAVDSTTVTNPGISIYPIPIPPLSTDVTYCAYDNTYLHRTSTFYLDNSNAIWAGSEGFPQTWKQDEVDPTQVQISPTPAATEGTRTLTLIGAQIPDQITGWQLTDVVPYLPDSLLYALKYGVLAKIFATDSEQKDLLKAAYCQARSTEAVNLIAAMMSQEFNDVAA